MMTMEQEIARLKEENTRLIGMVKGKNVGKLTFKVTAERQAGPDGPYKLGGQVSIYGLQKFPVTLGKEQWEKLLTAKEDILAYLHEQDGLGLLAVKDANGVYYVPAREPVEVVTEEPVTA
jgi:hypothetical protein